MTSTKHWWMSSHLIFFLPVCKLITCKRPPGCPHNKQLPHLLAKCVFNGQNLKTVRNKLKDTRLTFFAILQQRTPSGASEPCNGCSWDSITFVLYLFIPECRSWDDLESQNRLGFGFNLLVLSPSRKPGFSSNERGQRVQWQHWGSWLKSWAGCWVHKQPDILIVSKKKIGIYLKCGICALASLADRFDIVWICRCSAGQR